MALKNETIWEFLFFVSDNTLKTEKMVSILEEICKEHLGDNYNIKVIDIQEDPVAGMKEGIIATPTLIKKHPEPVRRIIGEVQDKNRLVFILDII